MLVKTRALVYRNNITYVFLYHGYLVDDCDRIALSSTLTMATD